MNDAARPAGRFITEHVLPQWEDLNAYRSAYTHNYSMNVMLHNRGVKVHQFKGLRAAFLFNGSVIGGRHGRLTTLISDQAAEATASKSLSRAYWSAAGLPVMQAHTYSESDHADAAEKVSRGGSWAVKSDSARLGRSASLPVQTPQEFSTAWDKALNARPRIAGATGEVLLEKFYDGLNLRFFVVAGQVRAALLRVPLFVLGDGKRTVRQLLEESFGYRRRHVLLRRSLSEISEDLLSGEAPRLADIPADSELRILNEVPNMSMGGLPVDVTSQVSEDLRALAEQAAVAIPGLGMAGIDILTTGLDSAEYAVLMDADCRASIRPHLYPAFGRRRPIAGAVARQTRLRAEQWDWPLRPASGKSGDGDYDDD